MPAQDAVQTIVDEAPAGSFRVLLVVLACVVIMIDGYDAVSIGFAAPELAKALNVPIQGFGPVFASGLFGLLIGSLILSPLADRFGRKSALLGSVFLFGVFTLAPLFDLSFQRLLLYRFLTGLGLGGAMPCVIALATEYIPRKRLALLLNVILAGFPFGAVAGGFLTSGLVATYGWRVIFVIGGGLPLLLLPVLMVAMPNSLRYLLAKPHRHAAATRVLRRLDPARPHAPERLTVPATPPGALSSVADLFNGGRLSGTLLLWLANFCSLYILFFINNWLPALMTATGTSLGQAILGPALMNLGGVVGGIAMGPLIDRVGPYRVLSLGFAAGAICVACLGPVVAATGVVLAVAFAAGFFIDGVQLSLNALATMFYPAAVRTTGVGWALAIGRVGSVIGPMTGGLLLQAHWGAPGLFATAALPAVVGAVAVSALGLIYARRSSEPETATLAADQIA